MIIHKEQTDCILPDGTPSKKLIVSYVNKEGNVSFLQYPVPKEQMFEWKYTTKSNADPPFYEYDFENNCYKKDDKGDYIQHQWMSYDGKPVAKKPTNELSTNRINEILCSFGKKIDPIFEMNVPYTWFCDIEVEVTAEGFPEPEDAKTPINTISMSRFPQTIIWSRKNLTEDEKSWVQEQIEKYSEDPQICGNPDMKDISKGYKFEFRYFKTEREMLDDFLNFCIPITAIAGWNFLNFDWLYITNRCIKNGLDIDKLSPTRKNTTFKITPRSGGATINLKLPMHKMVYDYMLVFKTWDQTVESCENHSLDYIGHRVLGIGKKPHDWGFIDGYEKYFADYVFYNCIDTIILEQIDKQINTAKIWFMLTSILRIDSYDAFSTIRPTETVMCNFEYPHYRVFPNVKREIPKEQEKYQGAWVLPVQPNMYRMVGGLDFASLYPSIMRQFLISPESFIKQDINHVPKKDEIKTISGAVYKRDENSMIPAILTHYFGMRKQAKSDMKQADTERQYYLDILTKRLNKI